MKLPRLENGQITTLALTFMALTFGLAINFMSQENARLYIDIPRSIGSGALGYLGAKAEEAFRKRREEEEDG